MNSFDFSSIPFFSASSSAMPCSAAYLRTSSVIFIEQKCGPHMEQKCAVLAPSCGQRFVVKFARGDGVEAEVELIFPAEFEARLAQRVVAVLRAGMALGEVGGVRGDLVGDDAVFNVLLVRQAEVFLGRDVAEHRAAIPADHRRADAAGNVVATQFNLGKTFQIQLA